MPLQTRTQTGSHRILNICELRAVRRRNCARIGHYSRWLSARVSSRRSEIAGTKAGLWEGTSSGRKLRRGRSGSPVQKALVGHGCLRQRTIVMRDPISHANPTWAVNSFEAARDDSRDSRLLLLGNMRGGVVCAPRCGECANFCLLKHERLCVYASKRTLWP